MNKLIKIIEKGNIDGISFLSNLDCPNPIALGSLPKGPIPLVEMPIEPGVTKFIGC